MKKLIILLSLITSFNLYSEVYYEPQNLDFELGKAGTFPYGWKFDRHAIANNMSGGIDNSNFISGSKSFAFLNYQDSKHKMTGSIYQSFDAVKYRSQKVRLRVAVKTEFQDDSSRAYIWMKDFYNKVEYKSFVISENGYTNKDWEYYEIEMYVSIDAVKINIGVMLEGFGNIFIDDIQFETIKDGIKNKEPAKELSKIELNNLLVYSQIYGISKYYSPTYESALIDWDNFLYHSLFASLNSKSNTELEDSLSYYFKSVNPGIIISENKISDDNDFKTQDNKSQPAKLIFKHTGAYSQLSNSIFNTEIKNFYFPNRQFEGSVFHNIKTDKFGGLTIKLSAYVKTNLINEHSNAQLWMRIVSEGPTKDINVNMMDLPIKKDKWENYSIEYTLPKSAKKIVLALVMLGEGDVWFDDLKFEFLSKGKYENLSLPNKGFEDNDENSIFRGWTLSKKSAEVGYYIKADKKIKYSGDYSLRISSDTNQRVIYPEDNAVYKSSKNGINFNIPYVIDTDSRGYTIPKNNNFSDFQKQISPIIYSENDRASRLSIIVDFWNYIKHFNINNLSNITLDNLLYEALSQAAIAKNKNEFEIVLRTLLANTDDSGARVWKGANERYYAVPINWVWVKGNLFISNKTEEIQDLEVGDIILEINDEKTEAYLKKYTKLISASSNNWKRLRALAFMRIGNKGSELKLLIRNSKGEKKTVNLKYNVSPEVPAQEQSLDLSDIGDDILYANLSKIKDKDILKNVSLFETFKGIIFDLRGSALVSEHFIGYFIDSAINANQWRLYKYTGPEEYLKSPTYRNSVIRPIKSKITKNIVFLINEKTIAYSEMIANTIKYYKLFPLIGTETAGAFGDAMSFNLPGGYSFSMTIWDAYDPSGKRLNQTPLQPDYLIEPASPINLNAEEKLDPQLYEAILLLQKNIKPKPKN